MTTRGLKINWQIFLIFIVMVETMYIICNFRSDTHRCPIYVNENKNPCELRRIFKQPANFTPREIYLLENDFEDQDHPLLLERLRTHWIHKPSPGPLKLSNMGRVHYSQHNQSETVDKLLQGKTDGFYVECGAFDGEGLSNSLFFERRRNWKGLLIEAMPSKFAALLSKQRNAYSINACLNTVNKTGKYQFYDKSLLGGLVHAVDHDLGKKITVQCFTLYSILSALEIRKIDFFSLDVEGAELGVLKTIPYTYLNIDVLLVEYNAFLTDKKIIESRCAEIEQFLESKGYELISKTDLDLLYRKKRSN